MKNCIIISACILLMIASSSAAFAADPSINNWTGCFAGVHAGGAFGDDKIRSSNDFGSGGVIGGGQIGCDYQFASAWVVGFEGRAAWSSLSSNTPGTGIEFVTNIQFPTRFTVANDFLASATGRVGYSLSSGWLSYVRGGAAWTHENSDVAFIDPALGAAVDPRETATRTGWTVGTGLDWAFAPHWSTFIEYD
jgi:outer membrane immunogenic protein